jgi:hypothetical protein
MKFLDHIRTNWKTTAAGVGTILVIAPKIAENPQAAMQPEVMTALVTAIGLLFASDSRTKAQDDEKTR